MVVVSIYACATCGTLCGRPNTSCCVDPKPNRFFADFDRPKDNEVFPDLVDAIS